MAAKMRIPWLATLDALIAELNSHLDEPVCDGPSDRFETRTEPRGLDLSPPKEILPAPTDATDRLRRVIKTLKTARDELEMVALTADKGSLEPNDYYSWYGTLEDIESRQVRYPDLEGREGLARLLERGGLIGPVLGRHIASVLLGSSDLKAGTQGTFEKGRERRFAIKRIATIRHLYGVGLRKAVAIFCEAHVPNSDDPEARANSCHEQWVKRATKAAKEKLSQSVLSDRDRRNCSSVLYGLYPDAPRGILAGRPYPEALEQFSRSTAR